ncbi:hypothetical protein FFLO_03287 [Filobasidium floriforme]|uniref:Uncharacterized protein n=1 Tax=Filobasidium floriforme TaxID=5210 RepID=A0A8K0NQZ5_9TREE|nr:uncharacterized protein HD553DRAFT_337541 [Filobasidium floriforme]KAG7544326.1 hypothetical protein FFLO_03287 [Filobasidium floriforme]KAH8078644.1 hypothetical protein HD553DRAFT_337541 [Filobasidium floriforme]
MSSTLSSNLLSITVSHPLSHQHQPPSFHVFAIITPQANRQFDPSPPTFVGSPPGKSPASREELEKELIFSRPGALISALRFSPGSRAPSSAPIPHQDIIIRHIDHVPFPLLQIWMIDGRYSIHLSGSDLFRISRPARRRRIAQDENSSSTTQTRRSNLESEADVSFAGRSPMSTSTGKDSSWVHLKNFVEPAGRLPCTTEFELRSFHRPAEGLLQHCGRIHAGHVLHRWRGHLDSGVVFMGFFVLRSSFFVPRARGG